MNLIRLLAGSVCMGLSAACPVCLCAASPEVLTLEEIFASAETNSTQLKPWFAAEKEADLAVSVARSNRLPDISASLQLSYIGDGFTTKRNFSDYQKAPIPHLGDGLAVGVSQPVYTGGAITHGIEIAELKSTAARYATDFQRDNLRFSLTGFYLDIYKYTNLREVVENNISQAEKVLAEMHSRYDQGVVLHNDITRYELLLSNLRLQIVKIDNMLSILNSSLVTLAALPPDIVVRPDSTILSRSLPKEGEMWWQQEAAANAPQLSLARSGVDISRSSVAVAKAERLPSVGIMARWSVDGPILTEIPPIDRNLSYWYVGVGITYNISSLFKSNRKISQRRAALVQAEQQLDATRQNLELAVRSDYIRYLEAYEELKTRRKAVELAEVNYSTVSTRYSEGMALITDLIDAANQRLESQQQLVDSRIDIIYYYYKLLFTSGKI